MTRFLIYDDNRTSCEELRSLIYNEMNGQDIEVCIAVNRYEAEIQMKRDISVLFLDIALPNEENGINFACLINRIYPKTKIIFITAYIKYCEEIFIANPVGFLVKPFTAGKVARVLEILKNNLHKDDFLIINSTKNNITKLHLNELIYVESINRKLVYHMDDEKEIYESMKKLSSLDDVLPDYFLRCHNSFYVNLNYVSCVQRYEFTLKNGIKVPISQNKFKTAREKFMCFLGELI